MFARSSLQVAKGAPSRSALSCRSRAFSWNPLHAAPVLALSADQIPSVHVDFVPLMLGVVLSAIGAGAVAGEALFRVEKIDGKGDGAFANKSLKVGEVIIAERPLCIWPQVVLFTVLRRYRGLIQRCRESPSMMLTISLRR